MDQKAIFYQLLENHISGIGGKFQEKTSTLSLEKMIWFLGTEIILLIQENGTQVTRQSDLKLKKATLRQQLHRGQDIILKWMSL